MKKKIASLILLVGIVAAMSVSSVASNCGPADCESTGNLNCTEYFDETLNSNVCRCVPVN